MNKTVTNYQYFRPSDEMVRMGIIKKGLCVTLQTTITKLTDSSNRHIVEWSSAFKNPHDEFSKEFARKACQQNADDDVMSGYFYVDGLNRPDIVSKIFSSLHYNSAMLSTDYHIFIKGILAEYVTDTADALVERKMRNKARAVFG